MKKKKKKKKKRKFIERNSLSCRFWVCKTEPINDVCIQALADLNHSLSSATDIIICLLMRARCAFVLLFFFSVRVLFTHHYYFFFLQQYKPLDHDADECQNTAPKKQNFFFFKQTHSEIRTFKWIFKVIETTYQTNINFKSNVEIYLFKSWIQAGLAGVREREKNIRAFWRVICLLCRVCPISELNQFFSLSSVCCFRCLFHSPDNR